MRILETEPKVLNDEQLHESIVSLRRSEQDFEKRVPEQVAALERAGRRHGSDPVYQPLVFLLRKFTQAAQASGNRGGETRCGAQRICFPIGEVRIAGQLRGISPYGGGANLA